MSEKIKVRQKKRKKTIRWWNCIIFREYFKRELFFDSYDKFTFERYLLINNFTQNFISITIHILFMKFCQLTPNHNLSDKSQGFEFFYGFGYSMNRLIKINRIVWRNKWFECGLSAFFFGKKSNKGKLCGISIGSNHRRYERICSR